MNPRPVTTRPLAPRCRGGASSLLRLSAAGAARWPAASQLADWAGGSREPVGPAPAPMVASSATASPLFTRLWPSGAPVGGMAVQAGA